MKSNHFYILTGEEKALIQMFIKKTDENAVLASSFSSINAKLRSRGLFNKSATYVIHNDKELLGMTADEIISKLGDNGLILIYDTVDKRTKLMKSATKYIIEYKKMNDSDAAKVVMKTFKDNDVMITEPLAAMIAQRCSNDYYRMENECDKLINLCEVKGAIVAEDVKELIVAPLEDKIFDMLDSIMKRDARRTYAMYKDLIEMKESPIKVISVLYTKVKQVFLVQAYGESMNDAQVAEKAGMTPWQIKFTKPLTNYFSLEQMLIMLKHIQSTEVDMKTGKIPIEIGMDNLLLSILNKKSA